MHIEGDAPLDLMVWLTEASEAQTARALAEAAPGADWMLQAMERARLRFRGVAVDIELAHNGRWIELFSGRVAWSARPGEGPFRPYSLEWSPPPMQLESCWFAVDRDLRVGCFDRDQLGAAPMKRCRGPRPQPTPAAPAFSTLAAALAGHHAAPADAPARAFAFVADPAALTAATRRDAPEGVSRRWSLAVHGDRVLVSAGRGTMGPAPIAASMIDWLHRAGVCHGCARASLRDARLLGVYVFQCTDRARATPYERMGEPFRAWSIAEAASALSLRESALRDSALPVRFEDKDRLQPLEYVPCTWSETVPWENEAGERFGADVSRAPR